MLLITCVRSDLHNGHLRRELWMWYYNVIHGFVKMKHRRSRTHLVLDTSCSIHILFYTHLVLHTSCSMSLKSREDKVDDSTSEPATIVSKTY